MLKGKPSQQLAFRLFDYIKANTGPIGTSRPLRPASVKETPTRETHQGLFFNGPSGMGLGTFRSGTCQQMTWQCSSVKTRSTGFVLIQLLCHHSKLDLTVRGPVVWNAAHKTCRACNTGHSCIHNCNKLSNKQKICRRCTIVHKETGCICHSIPQLHSARYMCAPHVSVAT